MWVVGNWDEVGRGAMLKLSAISTTTILSCTYLNHLKQWPFTNLLWATTECERPIATTYIIYL